MLLLHRTRAHPSGPFLKAEVRGQMAEVKSAKSDLIRETVCNEIRRMTQILQEGLPNQRTGSEPVAERVGFEPTVRD